MPRPLKVEPCNSECNWRPSGEDRAGELVFHCTGCGSEWVRSEGWTPRNLDGSIARGIERELSRPTG